MTHNPYLLQRLPLLPDQILVQTRKAYREVFAEFERSEHSETTPVEATRQVEQLKTALGLIEDELNMRGIGRGPWWSDGNARV